MIRLTRIDGRSFLINEEMILQVESTPDTVVTLTVGDSVLVKESPDEVLSRIVAFRRLAGSSLSVAEN